MLQLERIFDPNVEFLGIRTLYLCRCFYGRDAEKCYKYSNNALDEIDVDNLEEYVPILFMNAISYGDIINEKIKDISNKIVNNFSQKIPDCSNAKENRTDANVFRETKR